jgi:beta-phosphoglucomutase
LTKPKHAILWDLDGTIVDTKDCHFFTWKYAMKKHGIELEKGTFEASFGRNNAAIIPSFLGYQPDEHLLAEIINDKEGLFREIAPMETKLVPGVEDWLATAGSLHFAQAIASSAPMENIAMMLKNFKLKQYFDAIISGTTLPAKPEPDIFLVAADNLSCSPIDCLVIEDSLAGVAAAKSAGMQCIAVTTTHPRDELGEADLVVDDYQRCFIDVLQSFGWV